MYGIYKILSIVLIGIFLFAGCDTPRKDPEAKQEKKQNSSVDSMQIARKPIKWALDLLNIALVVNNLVE